MDEPVAARLCTERLVIECGHDARPNTWHQWTVAGVTTSQVLGAVEVRFEAEEPTAEIRVSITVDARGHGYGTESLRETVHHLLDVRGLVRVVAIAHHEDDRVHRLLGRVGLVPVALDGEDVIFSCTRRSLG